MERQIYDLLYRISEQLDRISRDLQRLAYRNDNPVDTGIKEEDY